MAYRHIPAMLNETIRYLNCRPGKTYTDCTLGGSGHAKAICERIQPNGLFIGIDQDIDAIINAPEAAILAVGATQNEAIPDDDGQIVSRPVMRMTLTADHRQEMASYMATDYFGNH